MPLIKPQPGDDLQTFALRHGVSQQALRGCRENADLLAARDSAVLCEADELFVPDDVPPKQLNVRTGGSYTIVHAPPMRTLYLVLRDDMGNTIDADYTLTLEYDPAAKIKTPTLLYGYAHQGIVREDLSALVTKARLVLNDAEQGALTLELGKLDPVSTSLGLLARLQLLGLYLGPIEENLFDYDVQQALRQFQLAHGLPVTGAPDPVTRKALVTACGK